MWHRQPAKVVQEQPLDNEFRKYLEQRISSLERSNAALGVELSKYKSPQTENILNKSEYLARREIEIAKKEGQLDSSIKEQESKVKILESTIVTLNNVITKLCGGCK